jgi:chloramphenicol 3-O phosphotransferase
LHKLGVATYAEALAEHREILRRVFSAHGGVVFWGGDRRTLDGVRPARCGGFPGSTRAAETQLALRCGSSQVRLETVWLVGCVRLSEPSHAKENDVVVDDVLIQRAWLDDGSEVLAGLDTLLVGIHCDLETLERRERERGNRVLGEARGQVDFVHRGALYHVEVDTSSASPEECASVIRGPFTQVPRAAALRRYLRGNVYFSVSTRMNGAGRVGWLAGPSTRTTPSKVS